MNARHQLYKKYRLQGMSKYAAARKAGYSHNTAVAAKQNIEKRLGPDFTTALEMAGLTDKALADHAAEGLAAMKKVSTYYESEGGPDEKDESGYEVSEVPDWQNRHKYFESICKLRGKIKDTPLIDNSTHTHFTVITDGQASNDQADAKTDVRIQTANKS